MTLDFIVFTGPKYPREGILEKRKHGSLFSGGSNKKINGLEKDLFFLLPDIRLILSSTKG